MKAYFLQRVTSYIIDLVIISLVSYVVLLFVPTSKAYEDALDRADDATNSYIEGKISEKEYLSEYGEANYIMAKEGAVFTVISLLITTAYFGTYSYYKNGQTVGKKLMKIKVETMDGKTPSHPTLILRTLIIYGVITNVISLILLLFIKANMYIGTIGAIEAVQSLFVIVTIFMIIFRKDGRGLHDLICKTRVISTK